MRQAIRLIIDGTVTNSTDLTIAIDTVSVVASLSAGDTELLIADKIYDALSASSSLKVTHDKTATVQTINISTELDVTKTTLTYTVPAVGFTVTLKLTIPGSIWNQTDYLNGVTLSSAPVITPVGLQTMLLAGYAEHDGTFKIYYNIHGGLKEILTIPVTGTQAFTANLFYYLPEVVFTFVSVVAGGKISLDVFATKDQ